MNELDDGSRYEHLVQTVAPGSRLLRAWALGGGMSAEMSAVEMEHPDGKTERIVVRRPGLAALQRSPRAARDEYLLLQFLHSLGVLVPAAVYLDESSALFPQPFLVMEYIEGKMDFQAVNLERRLEQFAARLAQIHQIEGFHPDLAFLPQKAVECPETNQKQPSLTEPLLQTTRIQAILEQAGRPARRNALVLLHGDYWPGNVLWQGEQLAAVIDWEDAGIGDPLIDLAISRLDLAWIFGIDAMRAFTEQYQTRAKIDATALPYWDLCAALRLARLAGQDLEGWTAYFHPYGRQDITRENILENFRLFTAQAFQQFGLIS